MKAAAELLLYEPKNYWRRSMCEHRIEIIARMITHNVCIINELTPHLSAADNALFDDLVNQSYNLLLDTFNKFTGAFFENPKTCADSYITKTSAILVKKFIIQHNL